MQRRNLPSVFHAHTVAYTSAQAISILMLSNHGVAALAWLSASALAFLNCRATYLDLTPSP
eukprot:5329033-Amphidinium_carterae.1